MNGLKLAEDRIINFKIGKYRSIIRGFISYNVILDDVASIAHISYYDKDASPIVTLDYPIVTLEEIADAINNGEEINLNYCYIKNFSSGELGKRSHCIPLTLKNFSARHTFFDNGADFSCVQFEDGHINFICAVFGGRADFRSTKFSGNTYFGKTIFTEEAHFNNTMFRRRADFKETTFAGKTYFRESTFAEKTNFWRTIFKEEVYFGRDANVERGVYFRKTTFTGDSDFRKATFTGNANFGDANFAEKAYFGDANFAEKAYFRRATFLGKADFSYAEFSKRADFGETTFTEKADVEKTTFTKKADFSSATFSEDADFGNTTFAGNANFENTMFAGNAYFGWTTVTGNANFKNSKFTEETRFSNTTFSEGADFNDAKFIGRVNFWGTTFTMKAHFEYTTFPGEANFSNTTFHKRAYFNHAKFTGIVNFWKITFARKVHFEWTTFTKESTFKNATFLGEANFDATKFGGEVYFKDVIFKEKGVHFAHTEFIHNVKITLQNNASQALIAFESCAFSKLIRLNSKECPTSLTLKHCTIRDLCTLKGKITHLSLDETKNLGSLYIDWKIAKTINLNSDTPKSKAEQMCMLKENYHTIGDYDNEDNAYIAYRHHKRQILQAKLKEGKYNVDDHLNVIFYRLVLSRLMLVFHKCYDHLCVFFDRPFCHKCYDRLCIFFDRLLYHIGRYATQPGRVAGWMLFAWLLFGVIFAISIFCGGIYLGTEEELKKANYGFFDKCGIGFYFSAITLLTIGYGDVHPEGWFTQTVAPVAGFVGLFLMSYFTVAVVRKTLR